MDYYVTDNGAAKLKSQQNQENNYKMKCQQEVASHPGSIREFQVQFYTISCI